MSRLSAAHVAGALADYISDIYEAESQFVVDSGHREVAIVPAFDQAIVNREMLVTASDDADPESEPTMFAISVRRVNAKKVSE